MADVSRLKFQGVIPGAPVGIHVNAVEQQQQQQRTISKQCGDELKSQQRPACKPAEQENVLVTPL